MANRASVVMNVKGDINAIARDLKTLHPTVVRKAQYIAINKTLRAIRTRAIRGAVQKLQAPSSEGYDPKVFFSKRTRNKNARYWKLEGSTTMRLHPMAADLMQYATTPTMGALAGRWNWPKGFAGRPRGTGKKRLFIRKGAKARPIKLITIPLDRFVPILAKVGNRVMASKFKAILEKELAIQLKKYAGRY